MSNLSKIQKWYFKHRREVSRFAGKWVAVSVNGIVDSAGSLSALSKKLSEEQKSSLLLTRILTKKEAANIVYSGRES